ncbi:MAG: phasin family protein [Beijerinckiaceae bacterium]
MFKSMDEMQKYGKDQFDAMASVSTAFSKGVQKIATEASDYSKKSFEQASSAAEQLAGAKSFEAAVQVQTDYAKQAYEAFVAQAKKMGDLYTTLAKDTFKPVETVVAKTQAAAK